MPTAEICRRHGLSPATFYKLKALADENVKLKRLLANTMLDNVILRDLLGKN